MYESIPTMQKESENNIQNLSDLEDELYKLESKYFKLFDENKILKKQLEDNEEKIKDINVKLQDFNIVDLIKNNLGTEGGDMNIILGLISSGEKKANDKYKLIDEKISKINETCFKMTRDVQDVKNTQELNKRQFESIKKELENLKNNYESLNKNMDINFEDINEKLEKKIKYIENKLKESFEKTKNYINLKFSTMNENNVGQVQQKEVIDSNEIQNMNIENNEAIKMLKESISEIHKKIKLLPNQKDLDQIRTDISSLKSGINNCVSLSDFKEAKELQEENTSNLKKLREEFEDFKFNQTEDKDIQSIKRKLEIFINKVNDLEDINNQLNKKISDNNPKIITDDKNKFLDSKSYNDFKFQITKEFNNINENFINSRKLLDELIDSVRNRTSYKDLKALEDALMSKLEELKISSSKKFADRNEVNRTIKYLDQQIRNIVQVYIKKIDIGENWLLAKKNITNNLCASCENYIGDLKDNSNNNLYIPWNKFPVKDNNDKLYRMGHGFSKMLQMIQVDENDKKNTFQINKNRNKTRSDFFNGSGINASEISPRTKKINNLTVNMSRPTEKSLPKLKKYMLTKKNFNLTLDQEPNINLNDSGENEEEPKITKITRVNKDSQ